MYFPRDKRLDGFLRVALLAVLAVLAVFFSAGCSAVSVTEDRRRVDLNDPAVLRAIAQANGYAVDPFADAAERKAGQAYCDGLGHAYSVAYGMYGVDKVACFSQVEPGRVNPETIAMFDLVVCRQTYGLRYRVFDDRTRVLECW